MRVMAVENELDVLNGMVEVLHNNHRVMEVKGYDNGLLALEWLKQNKTDVVFMNIALKEINGLLLAEKMKEIQPDLFIVFVTDSPQYALQAFRVHAIGYLLKPIDKAKAEEELDNIAGILNRREIAEKKKDKVRIQTFGNFEVYYQDEIVRFHRSISKEILAYLVDRRGASVSMGELETLTLEYSISENSRKSLIRTAIAELRSVFRGLGQEQIIVKERNFIRIVPDQIECDYYNFLSGNTDACNSYMGEYMAQYSWAEVTMAMLESKNNKILA